MRSREAGPCGGYVVLGHRHQPGVQGRSNVMPHVAMHLYMPFRPVGEGVQRRGRASRQCWSESNGISPWGVGVVHRLYLRPIVPSQYRGSRAA